jgi:hypothetical protein
MTLHDDLDPARGIIGVVLFTFDLALWLALILWWVTR